MEELIKLLKCFNQSRDGETGHVFTKQIPNNQGIIAVHTKLESSMCTLEFVCPASLAAEILKTVSDLN